MLTGWTDFDRAFSSLDELRRRMEQFFEEVDIERFRPLPLWPHTNLTDTGECLVLEAEVPGCTERDIEISVTQEGLTLKGVRRAQAPEGYSVLRRERRDLEFSRSFELPRKIDPERVEATVRDGLLCVKLPKSHEAQPKRIEVKALH